MKKLIVLLFVCFSVVHVKAERQTTIDTTYKGVRFEEGLSWKQVQAKAKKEGKFIFVDCFTTWCGPCKEMDRDVYPVESVGEFINTRFISAKMQLDTSKNDNDAVKKRYADASFIGRKYQVLSYPTFLVFDSTGRILNKGVGSMAPDKFIDLMKGLIDPSKNYYTVLAEFKEGKTSLEQTSWLAIQGLVLGDTAGSEEVSRSFIMKMNPNTIFTPPNIRFLNQFAQSSDDKGFRIIYDNPEIVDSVMNNDTYAQAYVQKIIYREIINPELAKANQSNTEPDWDKLSAIISKKYNAYYAEMVITGAKSTWGQDHKNMIMFTKWLVVYQDKFGSKKNTGEWAAYELNQYAWAIFLNSNNPDELNAALRWSGRAVLLQPGSNWMDTYANILYKLGRRDEAMMWENIGLKISPTDNDLKANLEKMKNNQPTWPEIKIKP